ncbi:hypothetical protein L1049_019461 [Liquidambar formosana]|uniref:Uncharacterized protein n=1 Tax=Liquidambar formosana TaxID=63359 RepID=A0AAP0S5T4_LIQFO
MGTLPGRIWMCIKYVRSRAFPEQQTEVPFNFSFKHEERDEAGESPEVLQDESVSESGKCSDTTPQNFQDPSDSRFLEVDRNEYSEDDGYEFLEKDKDEDDLQKFQSDELAAVHLYQENKPSVVYITNIAVRPDASTFGSGFVWDKDGHVVTNYHVIVGASHLRVKLADQLTFDAKVVGFDPDKDVAVLHVDAPKDKLRPIRVGTSADLLVGQKVHAIGNPFGLEHSLTIGNISGLHREISSPVTGHPMQDVIQTDAAINPGNSGGPLLDRSGRLIGINTSIYSPSGASSGVSFSIPVDTVSGLVDQWVKPILGIKFAPDQFVEQLEVSGVHVLDAPANGLAGKVGLQPMKCNAYGGLILGDIYDICEWQRFVGLQPIKCNAYGGLILGDTMTSVNGSDLYSILDQCKVKDKMILWMD